MPHSAWANLEWHHSVHEHLGEQLVYYVIRVRPFDVREITARLARLVDQHQLEAIRSFLIFGPNDLLVRAWLHAKVVSQFPGWLEQSLIGATEIRQFNVQHVEHRSYAFDDAQPPRDARLLDSLDDDLIRALQRGQDPRLLEKLLKAGLVHRRDQITAVPIKFFVAVNLAQKDHVIRTDAVNEIKNHVLQDLPSIRGLAIYRGFGFGDLLIKGEVTDNFFSIGSLVDWVWERLKRYGASTETYIATRPAAIIEAPDAISETTFRSIQGLDLFVQSVIPELYATYYGSRSTVEPFVLELKSQITAADKKTVHDYLRGFLDQRPSEMGIVLFTFFSELEEYLRNQHREFAARHHVSVPDLYIAVGASTESGKHVVLGHLLEMCSRVAHSGDDAIPSGQWQDLVALRNKVFHGDYDYLSKWQEPLRIVVRYTSRLRQLLRAMKISTGKGANLQYLAGED